MGGVGARDVFGVGSEPLYMEISLQIETHFWGARGQVHNVGTLLHAQRPVRRYAGLYASLYVCLDLQACLHVQWHLYIYMRTDSSR